MPPGDGSRDPGITMWGATSTGKTTFLAALSIALMRQKAQWRVGGTDQASVDRLTELTTRLTADRLFPSATQGVEHYNWELIGTVRRAGQRRWRWLAPTYYDESVRIPLHLIDAPGEAADRSKARGNSVLWDGLLGNMVDSRGIVFFYDPVREFTNGDAFTHTIGVLNELSQRMRSAPGGRLPHYVSVCIAKFDEIKILETADKLGLLEYDLDPPGFPRVPDDEAREFFAQLCTRSDSGDAEMALTLLEQTFWPDRIRFFVTSAIGFYVDPHLRVYDRDNYQNHLPPEDENEPEPKPARIRGPVYPINVVEPILWLGKSMAGESGE